MQKMLLALAALATVAACSDPNTEFCINSQECSADKTTEEATEECNKDSEEGEEEGDDKCKAEGDALISCLNANGTCDEIGEGDFAVKIFGAKASGEGGACETEAKASTDCNT